jgi:alkylation response protein AidB-like acyl-CoA dehydrogenase
VTLPDPVAEAARLAPAVAARAEEVEQLRRLPDDLFAELRASGLFRMWLPHQLGGGAVDPSTFVAAIETLARADASTAWNVMIGASSAVVGGIMGEAGARRVFADPDTVIGGALAAKGRAERAADGRWQASGRWPFASGSGHCTWLVGGCIVQEGGRPAITPAGRPQLRTMTFPMGDLELLDTWHVSGLCGTDSNDFQVDGVLVDDELTFDVFETSGWTDDPLYRIPVFSLLGMAVAGVPLGIGRAALDELADLATRKRPAATPGQRLADQPLLHDRLARADAGLAAARSFVLEAVAQLYDEAQAGAPSLRTRAVVRGAISNAVDASVTAVDTAYTLAGGTSVYRSSPLQRMFRDVHAATQHVLLSPAMWPAAGRVLLGVDEEAMLF